MRWFLVALIVACNATGDLLNTAGMKRHGEIHHLQPGVIPKLLRSLARNARMVAGIVCLGMSFFVLLSLLSIGPLSFAVPATSSSYILETILAKYLLGEPVMWQRWLGAAIVACGVVLLAF
jgi:drug/metabolite transporter (DMT)-like permease